METVDIDSRYKRVGELLEAAEDSGRFDKGKNATVYSFDDKIVRLQPYILRKQNFAELKETTCLVAPEKIFHGNFGQPLLLTPNKDFAIHLRQSGTPLKDFLYVSNTVGKKSPTILMQKIIDAQKRTGINPFVELLRNFNRVRLSGYCCDPLIGNIFFDEEKDRFTHVDFLSPEMKNFPGRNLLLFLLEDVREGPKIKPIKSLYDVYEAVRKSFEDNYKTAVSEKEFDQAMGLLDQAYQMLKRHDKESHLPYVNMRGLRYNILSKCGFESVAQNHAIALNDPPSKLLAELKLMHGIVNSQAR